MNEERLKKIKELSGQIHYELKFEEVSLSTYKELIELSSRLEKELNPKVVMPRIFHIWLSFRGGDKNMALMRLAKLFTDNFDSYENGVEEDFWDWLILGGDLRSHKRYQMCVDAIVNGFEVESNE